MNVQCSRCHHVFAAPAEGHEVHCPSCHAEAGLEPLKSDLPPVIRNFAVLVAFVIAGALGSVIWVSLA